MNKPKRNRTGYDARPEVNQKDKKKPLPKKRDTLSCPPLNRNFEDDLASCLRKYMSFPTGTKRVAFMQECDNADKLWLAFHFEKGHPLRKLIIEIVEKGASLRLMRKASCFVPVEDNSAYLEELKKRLDYYKRKVKAIRQAKELLCERIVPIDFVDCPSEFNDRLCKMQTELDIFMKEYLSFYRQMPVRLKNEKTPTYMISAEDLMNWDFKDIGAKSPIWRDITNALTKDFLRVLPSKKQAYEQTAMFLNCAYPNIFRDNHKQDFDKIAARDKNRSKKIN